MALDATVGGAASNAYCTAAQATSYIEERLSIMAWYQELPTITYPWQELDARRDAALMQATMLLDDLVRWRGRPTTQTQALAWPQTGQVDQFGRPVDPAIVPEDIQRATAYYALALMQEANSAVTGSTTGSTPAIKRKRIGQTEIEYQAATTTVTTRPAAQRVPSEVMALVKPYGLTSTVAIMLART